VIICATLYIIIAIFPIIHLQRPYRTPLSGICWGIRRTPALLRFSIGRRRHHAAFSFRCRLRNHMKRTMTEVQMLIASNDLPGRDERDLRALQWTVESLAEDAELLPFVEGISKLLSHSRQYRYRHKEVMRNLVFDQKVLLARIARLLPSTSESLAAAGGKP
jgi:hypothetical protein